MYQFEKLYINGEWVLPVEEQRAQVINPATETVAAEYVQGGIEDVERAAHAAHQAFPQWANSSSSVRAGYILKIADLMEERSEELALAISTELGMPLHLCRDIQVAGPIEGLRTYAELAVKMDEVETLGNAHIVKTAIGVCAFINPWNYPLHQMIGKIAPALAAGCTMLVKPSEQTPIHSFILADIIDQAGLPSGVFNLLTGPGRIVGEALCTHPLVDMISFTGSNGAGTRVAQLGAESVKRVCLELGGKSPFIVADDVDLEAAVSFGVQDVMLNSGQTCTALSRMLVPEMLYSQAVEIAKNAAESLNVGDPMNANSDMGPMCSKSQRDTVLRYINLGVEEGASLITGGLISSDDCQRGYYIHPTIFADVNNSMTIAKDEIFGPVLCMISYSSLAEAIQIANDSEFGLSAAVWAKDQSAAMSIARKIDAGQVFVNGGEFNYSAPFGGYKKSGNGREWGEHGLVEFVETKAIMR